MKRQSDESNAPDRPRLKKETLRGLGFAELAQVHGGEPDRVHHPKPIATRRCLEP